MKGSRIEGVCFPGEVGVDGRWGWWLSNWGNRASRDTRSVFAGNAIAGSGCGDNVSFYSVSGERRFTDKLTDLAIYRLVFQRARTVVAQ